MQIDQVLKTDNGKIERNIENRMILPESVEKKEADKGQNSLPVLSVEEPFYQKDMLTKDTISQQLEKDMARGGDGKALCDQAAVYANTTSAQDLQKMQEEGFDPMETEVSTIITVVDRIKLALAKGGADISSMGGLSKEKVASMTGQIAVTNQIMQDLEDMDVPVSEEVKKDIETAVLKAQEIQQPLSQESISYLMKNQKGTSIDEIYQATYATSATADKEEMFVPKQPVEPEMEKAFSQVIEQAALPVTTETIADCGWMMEEKVAVTPENLIQLQAIKQTDVAEAKEYLADNVEEAILEGKAPGEADLLQTEGKLTQAKRALETQMQQLEEVKDARVRQEARLIMSVQANYSLLKKGIAIDTLEIEQVVEELKKLEASFVEELVQAETAEQTQQNVNQYRKFFDVFSQVKELPAAVLGQIEQVHTLSVDNFYKKGKACEQSFQEASRRYETLWTAPRKDMGDSLQKAFSNVEDILEDLQLPVTEESKRAVRILSYNEMPLTKDAIERIQTADGMVQKAFALLQPAVVSKMIKEGINPLDMSMEELTQTAEQLAKEQQEKQQESSYAKFLWKAEHAEDISPQERDSFIGVYRLIHQVEARDGAAIGALLAQGTEVTLRNLMMAVRSKKHTNREYAIDDSFGGLEQLERKGLSITDQVEMAFQYQCLLGAKEELTPARWKVWDGKETCMELTPEQLQKELQQLQSPEILQEEEALEEAYRKDVQQEVARALKSEQQVYEILNRYELPTTPAYLQGIAEMLRDKNQMYRKLLSYSQKQKEEDITIRDLMQEVIEDFGEAVKTPEEMAQAQRKLEETAENVMKRMLVEQEVSSVDVRSMKRVMTQLQMIGKMAEKSETYHIPIMVEDQVGNLSLKIVRGTEKKGLVDIALDTEFTGVVKGSFHYEAGEISGEMAFEKREVERIFSENMPYFAQRMTEETQLPVSFRFAWEPSATTDDFYQGRALAEEEGTKDEASTKVLYGIARSFIDIFSEII